MCLTLILLKPKESDNAHPCTEVRPHSILLANQLPSFHLDISKNDNRQCQKFNRAH